MIFFIHIWRILWDFYNDLIHHLSFPQLFWRPKLITHITAYVVCKCIAYVNAISFIWSLYLITKIILSQIRLLKCQQDSFYCISIIHTTLNLFGYESKIHVLKYQVIIERTNIIWIRIIIIHVTYNVWLVRFKDQNLFNYPCKCIHIDKS